MYREYIRINDKAVVSSDEDIRKITYCNNLEDILKLANITEEAKDRIGKLETKPSIEEIDNQLIKTVLKTIVSFVGADTAGMILWNILYKVSEKDSIIENINGVTAINTVCLSTTVIIILYNLLKAEIKTREARQNISQLEYLKKVVIENKEKLNKLIKNNNVKVESPEFSCVKIDTTEEIKNMEKILNIYKDCGKNLDKYQQYDENNILDEKLKSKYNREEINIVKTYVKEKKDNRK